MTTDFVIGFGRQAIELCLMMALPMLAVGLGVGVVVSIIQAATQIQETTLSFIPKIISMFIALLLALPWIMERVVSFTREVFINIPNYQLTERKLNNLKSFMLNDYRNYVEWVEKIDG